MTGHSREADVASSTRDERETGEHAGALEERIEDAFDRTVSEGEQRLHRGWPELLSTGAVGGIDVATGVLALLAVRQETHSQLLAGLAFSVGFIALLLAQSELFTEGFLVPVTALAAKRARPRDLARLWVGTLIANLAAGWLIMLLIMTAFPELHQQAIRSATPFATAPLSLRTICLAVIGGSTITLMTRMQHGTDSMAGKLAAAVGAAFLLAGLGMFHSILDSLLIFAALQTGTAPFGYADFAVWFSYTVIGNVIGGIGLVTLLRLVRSKQRLKEERRNS